MMNKLKVIPVNLYETYKELVSKYLQPVFDKLSDAEISSSDFSFYTSVSSVFSGKIEGEEIDLDSYIKHKKFKMAFLPDYTRKTDDLYNAYMFAKENLLNKKNIGKAHQLLGKHLIAQHQQGKIRVNNMYVSAPDGKIAYVAVSPFELKNELKNFYEDVITLVGSALTIEEVFFFASLVHLVFVNIHPFNDGNGRTARLLEKWFLASKLGAKAWFIQSEKYYYKEQENYYKNLNALGQEYDHLDYDKAMPFLLMLSDALVQNDQLSER